MSFPSKVFDQQLQLLLFIIGKS